LRARRSSCILKARMTQALVQAHPTEFFRNLLRQALAEQRVEPSPEAEFYLVALLERFMRIDKNVFSRPLALDYLEAFGDSPGIRYRKLRNVGDTALFLSGVFTDSLEGKVVGPDYYAELGGLAYRHLATLPATPLGSGVVALFTEMSVRFRDFARVLSQMSLQELFSSDRDLLRVYRRWLFTRGARDAEFLARRGIIPFAPPPKAPLH
jgi:hypothetical protein